MVHRCDPWECKQFLCNLFSNTSTCISAEMDAGDLDRRDFCVHPILQVGN